MITEDCEKNLLSDHVVFICGAGGLIGRRLVEVSLAWGASVVATDIDMVVLDALINNMKQKYPHLDQKIVSMELDLTSHKNIQDVLNNSVEVFGKVTDFVNAAYPRNQQYGREFFDVEYSDFCENISLNIGTSFLVSKLFACYFRKMQSGNIVNFGSVYGVSAPDFDIYPESMTMPVEYAAIKAAIIHLTKYMAQMLRQDGIRVNCISPGGVLDSQPEPFIRRYNAKCGNIGMLNPSHLDSTFLYLLSAGSIAVTGQNIVVDDGFTL